MSLMLRSAATATGLTLAILLGCESSDPKPAAAECRPGQFQGCEAECGRGVRHCLDTETGTHWSACSCVVLDASLPLTRGGAAGVAGTAAAAGTSGAAGSGNVAGGGAGGIAIRGCAGASGSAGTADSCTLGGAAGNGGNAGGANISGAAGRGGETS